MCKVQMLRALVKQRLTAAAQEIFGLFERTIAEYEEELCASKEENERQRELLDAVFNPQLRLHRADAQQVIGGEEEFTWFHQLKTHKCVGHQSSQLIHTQTEEKQEASSSTEHMETEGDGEDYGGPEPDRNSDSDRHLEPETDNSDDWKEAREPQAGLNSLNNDEVSLEKPFSCSECEKAFNDRGNLRNHMRIHTGEKPFSCSECEKSFRFKGDLKRHLRTHSGEKPFSCSTCGKKFGNSGHLNRHMRIHTGEKPFSCSFCEHRFLQRAHLDAHIRSHTGEKPFSCSSHQCVAARIHTGERPFGCSVCGKNFKHGGHLTQHMSVHTKENRFSCREQSPGPH
uniref:C2H2-type domain-containing protein n=1 Tax=Cyclopterus lumpus TaxID=8103 RepID=A0A8C2X5X1_CYCLU